jgi:tetratricopeptide (TPR) repeat protein
VKKLFFDYHNSSIIALFFDLNSRQLSLIQIEEKNTNAKLDILIQNTQFEDAIDFFKKEVKSKKRADIYQKWGDFLFNQGKFEESIEKYKETLGI